MSQVLVRDFTNDECTVYSNVVWHDQDKISCLLPASGHLSIRVCMEESHCQWCNKNDKYVHGSSSYILHKV